jgi:hypothetical protein
VGRELSTKEFPNSASTTLISDVHGNTLVSECEHLDEVPKGSDHNSGEESMWRDGEPTG